MGAQHQRAGVRGREELAHEIGPQQPCRAQLGDLHEEVHADAEEERQPRRERVHVEPAPQRGAHVLDAVGEGEGELLHRRRSRLLHVVAGDRDRVEARHLLRGEGDDVGDDAHRRLGGVDVGVADHEFLEDVVLDGAGERFRRHPLLLGRHDVHRHHRQHRAVHGHRHRHPVERNSVEEDFHVLDRVDGDTGLADVAGDTRVIGVVAAVGRQIERDGQSRLPCLEVAAVERVRFLGGGVARVLAQRPGPAGVHGGSRAPDERREAGQGIEMLQPFEVFGGVERLHVDAFRSPPREVRGGAAPGLLLDERRPRFQIRLHVTGHGSTSCLRGACLPAGIQVPKHRRVHAARNPASSPTHRLPTVSGRGA